MSVISLLMLVAAFLGISVPGIDSTTDHCPTTAGVPAGSFAEDWYAWERCLLAEHWAYADQPIGQGQARELVAQLWTPYQEWVNDTAMASFKQFRPQSNPRGWKVPPPEIKFGQAWIDDHCGTDINGCYIHGRSQVTDTRYTQLTPNRIYVPYKPSLRIVLHELAHAIDSYRWIRWDDQQPKDLAYHIYEATEGHPLSYRCIALDFYTVFADPVAVQILNRLCLMYAPDHPRLSTLVGPTDHEITTPVREQPDTESNSPNGWSPISGETVDGTYNGYAAATSDGTSVQLMITCWHEHGLEAFFYSATAIFDNARAYPTIRQTTSLPRTFGPRQRVLRELRDQYAGRVDWRFGDAAEKTTDYLDASDRFEALRMTGSDLDAFLEALSTDTSGQLHVVLRDGHQTEGSGTIQADGGAEVAAWAARCDKGA